MHDSQFVYEIRFGTTTTTQKNWNCLAMNRPKFFQKWNKIENNATLKREIRCSSNDRKCFDVLWYDLCVCVCARLKTSRPRKNSYPQENQVYVSICCECEKVCHACKFHWRKPAIYYDSNQNSKRFGREKKREMLIKTEKRFMNN